MSNKIANISLNLEQKNAYGRVFISEPDERHEKVAGRLFALIEIEGEKQKAKKITDFIIAELNEHYYQNEKIELREIMAAIKVESIFETVLIKTDSRLIEFLVKEKIKINTFKINITVGILYENELHFATIGSNQALLLYKEDGKYQIMPVEKGKEKDGDGKKLFSSIISGDMPAKSFFIFASQSLSEYIFNEEILDIITKLSPLSAAEQIKSTLDKINNYAPFAGIIIKNSQGQELLKEEPVELPKIPEIDKINSTEYKTEKILGPSVNLEENNSMPLPIDSIKSGLKSFGTLITRDKSKNNELRPLDKKKRQIIVGVIVFCLVAMLANIAYIKIRKQGEKNTNELTTITAQMTDKLADIQASLLYDDKDKAKKTYSDIKALMEQLNDRDKKKMENFADLEEEYIKQGQILAGVQEVKEEKIKSLAELNANISTIELSGDYIYAGTDKEIIKININSGDQETLALKSGQGITNSTNAGGLYFLAGNELLDISANKSISIENPGENVIGISMYNDKLYLYDQAKEVLNRFALKDDKYSEATNRLNGETKTVAFAIDLIGLRSDVYLLKSDGTLSKYYDANKQDFKTEIIEPALIGDNNKLLVQNNIYILDDTNKRIIIYSKDGKFIKQYASASFNDINNFTVDEKNSKIYLVSGNKIKKIDIE